jgi:integrase
MKGCRPLTEPEVEILQQSVGGVYAAWDRALFLLGVKSGFRISELLSLQLGDVWQHGRLVERVTVQRRHMKKKLEGRTVRSCTSSLRIILSSEKQVRYQRFTIV